MSWSPGAWHSSVPLTTPTAPTTPAPAATAPVWPLVGAAASAAAAAGLFLWAFLADVGHLSVAVSGYVLGGLVTTVWFVLHRVATQRAARSVWFSPRPALDRCAMALLGTGIAVGLVHAWALATELAKR